MPPSEVVRLLNKFFRVVIDVVESEGGFVNKFEGDAALCVFGAPVASDDPAGPGAAGRSAAGQRLEREVPEVGFGIGVSAGKAVAGNVGSEQRFEYTVIGDPVNEAARLSDLAKERRDLRGRLRRRARPRIGGRSGRVGPRRAHGAARPPRGDRPRHAGRHAVA